MFVSKAPPDGQIGEKDNLRNAGQRILVTEYRFDVEAAQRPQVCSPVLTTFENFYNTGGYVGDQPNPTHSGAAATGLYKLPGLVGKQHIREIYTSARPKRVIAPSASIDIEQLVLTVTRIELVLQFDQSIVIDGSQEALG